METNQLTTTATTFEMSVVGQSIKLFEMQQRIAKMYATSTIIPEMRYYVTKRDDEYIRSRLEDTVLWSIQTFNTYDKEYDYGEPGWMSERFCFCQGLMTEKYPDGSPASTWFALMPWASASIIEGVCGK